MICKQSRSKQFSRKFVKLWILFCLKFQLKKTFRFNILVLRILIIVRNLLQHADQLNLQLKRINLESYVKLLSCAYLVRDISSCWFISEFDKLEIANAFRVEVNDDFEICDEEVCDDEIKSVNISPVPTFPVNPQVFTPSHQQVSLATAQQVQCKTISFFFAFLSIILA